MSANGRRALGWVGVAIGASTLAFGSGMAARLLNVETREVAVNERDALRIELAGEIEMVKEQQRYYDARQHEMLGAISEMRGDIKWLVRLFKTEQEP